jgi:hypothetical protein
MMERTDKRSNPDNASDIGLKELPVGELLKRLASSADGLSQAEAGAALGAHCGPGAVFVASGRGD